MKPGFFIVWFVLVSSPLRATTQNAQFMAELQLAVDEPNPQLVLRSQKLVQEQLVGTFQTWPEFRGRTYDVKTEGREIVFYMMTEDDVRAPMQRAVSAMIQELNGRVKARGRSLYYRTPTTPAAMGFLDVGVDNTHTKLLYTAAQAVPLRQLLKELKSKLGNLSYLIPGECADQPVDWSFGDPGEIDAAQPKPVDVAMNEIATLFGLKYEKRNDTHIFSGGCQEGPRTRMAPSPARAQFLPTTVLGQPNFVRTQKTYRPVVYFPLVPLGD